VVDLRCFRSLLMTMAIATIVSAKSAYAWPLMYSAPEIRARVVDESNGEPVKNAVVFARWLLYSRVAGAPASYYYGDSVQDLEATTDQDGWFVLPAWGPKFHAPNSNLDFFVPQFRVFKGGYYGRAFSNEKEVPTEASEVKSEWNGKTMTLKPFDGNLIAYGRSIYAMWAHDSFNRCLRTCPRMVLATYDEWERIDTTMTIPPEVRRRQLRGPSFKSLDPADREFLEKFRTESKK
jgi:hypothetical protein